MPPSGMKTVCSAERMESHEMIVRSLGESAALLEEWVGEQLRSPDVRHDLLSETQLRAQAQAFLTQFTRAVTQAAPLGQLGTITGESWAELRGFLEDLSRRWASQGFSFSEVATFVFSLKQPLFERLRQQEQGAPETGQATQAVIDAVWTVSTLLDRLGLYTVTVYQRSREAIIERQRQEMLELSTPVVKIWEGVVALPLIGTLDSERTQVVMETLLERIVETGASVAIIDITGVPTVDTLVAQHLLRTVAATQLMGAECIISGIRPQIAQTIVQLGIDLSGVTTLATLADAIRVAMNRTEASPRGAF